MLAFAAGWTSILTYHAWSRGLLKPTVLFREISPDGSHQVVVTKQVRIPVLEFVDPAVTVRAFLQNKQGATLAKAEVGLCEDSDYRFPKINWNKDEVVLAALDQRNAGRTLRVPIGDLMIANH
jgi:hypothetical protein